MSIEPVSVFIEDDTIRILAYSYSDAGVLEDCTAVVCTLTDSAAAKKLNAEAMTKTATGTYQVTYTILVTDPHGEWQGLAKLTDGTGGSAKNTNIPFSVKVM